MESVEIRVHLFRREENSQNVLIYYRSIGINLDLLAEMQRESPVADILTRYFLFFYRYSYLPNYSCVIDFAIVTVR